MKVALLLLCAGSSRRFGGDTPKQYCVANGQALVAHTLQSLAMEPRIDFVQPVVAEGYFYAYQQLTSHLSLPFIHGDAVVGGDSRAESMAQGLAVIPEEYDVIAVHDAARVLPSPELLADVLNVAMEHGASVPGVSVVDTIKRVNAKGKVLETLIRSELRAVQTPQVARRDWLRQAIGHAGAQLASFTDDVSLLEHAGFPVYVSEGHSLNRKITTPEDLLWLKKVLTERQQ
ncbi:MAG: 2-C-methyl-D-erythritol 4-phosphate cytidylyltransferase [Zetaproteobacteria bacterium]|nr:2-C-methyl-D-erythritol 4-phosphate cytidylyltransferase [Zetaproteobacteria bacterium]